MNTNDDARRIKKLQDNLDYKNRMAREAEQQLAEQAKTNRQLMADLEQARAETAALKAEREQAVDIHAVVPLEVPEADLLTTPAFFHDDAANPESLTLA